MSEEFLMPREVEILRLDDIHHPQANMDLDTHYGEEVGAGRRAPLIRLWRAASAFGIGVSRKDVASPEGEAAKTTLERDGVPVVVRQTGGTAVPQGDGVVHVSYLFPRPDSGVTTDAYYRLLCNPLIAWLQERGCEATVGALPGSYCDGSYNILVDGRKLVGTAQAWRGGLAGMKSARPGYIVAHACMVVDFDMQAATECINRFYTLAGNPYRVEADTSTTLRDRLPHSFTGLNRREAADSVITDLERFYREWLQGAELL